MWFSAAERGLKTPLCRPVRTNGGSTEWRQKEEALAKVVDLKITIPYFVVRANLKENARLCRAQTFNENSGR